MKYTEGTRPWGLAVALAILLAGGAVLARSHAFDVSAAAADVALPDAAAPAPAASTPGDASASPL